MFKKIVFGIICLGLFGLCYHFTDSFSYAFIGMLLLLAYGFWLIRFELGIPFSKEKRAENLKKQYQKFKDAHDKNSHDNPTI